MVFKVEYILALAVAMCIIIVPAMSQGDSPGGMNGAPGLGMGQPEDHGLDALQDPAALGQGNGNGAAPLHDDKKFLGCNTLPKNPKDKKPIDKPATDKRPPNKPDGVEGPVPSNPEESSGIDPAGWVYQGKGPMDREFGINPADPGRRMGPRPIMPDSPRGNDPKKAPKKSIMKDWHKKDPRPLIKDDHKKMPRPLMDNYHPAKPPIKSIMGHLI